MTSVDFGLFKAAGGEYDQPTPSREWNVAQLLCHLAFTNELVAHSWDLARALGESTDRLAAWLGREV